MGSMIIPICVGVELPDGVLYINPATVSSVLHKRADETHSRPETVLIRTLDGTVHSFQQETLNAGKMLADLFYRAAMILK